MYVETSHKEQNMLSSTVPSWTEYETDMWEQQSRLKTEVQVSVADEDRVG